jgi:hypothetical protein
MRWARARNPDETQAVATVLREFFQERDGRYLQQRVEDELDAAKVIAERNRTNGKLGGRKPRARKTQSLKSGLPKERQSTNPLIHQSNTEEQPAKAAKSKAVTLREWVMDLGDEDAVPVADPIFQWAETQGISADWIALAWFAFENRYGDDEKKYTDWRAVFRRALRDDWLRLWRHGRNGWDLTTAGIQAEREMCA